MKILLVEDDAALCGTIKEQLAKEGHLIDACLSGEDGIFLALNRDAAYELAVIDRMLPVVDGLTIIKAMREKQIRIPVIIITGMSELEDKIDGLDSGADDYLVKPFHIRELSARIRALSRRPQKMQETSVLTFGDLSLDLSRQQLECKERQLFLTPKEFHLLSAFMRTPETICSREQLMRKVWDADTEVENGNVDNYVYFLRKRLKMLDSSCIIRSVYGSGYILEDGHDKDTA